MEKTEKAAEVVATKTANDKRLSFTMTEIIEMMNEPKLAGIVENLSKDETNANKSGSYLLGIARGVIKQLNLL